MTVVGPVISVDVGTSRAGNHWVRVMGTFACSKCRHFSMAHGTTSTGGAKDFDPIAWLDTADQLEWVPSAADRPPPFDDVPDSIRDPAEEAYRCRSAGAFRGAILLARSVIEASAKERGITSGRLIDKIDKLHAQQLIRVGVRDGAHEVRHLGNDMAHGDFDDPVRPEDVEIVLRLMVDLLDDVFVQPARVSKAQAKRAQRGQQSTQTQHRP